jgi:hypothetical protein
MNSKEIYSKTLTSEEIFTDIVSVNFSKLPIPYFTLLTFYNKSGEKIEFSNCNNEKLVKNIIKAFSKR